MKFEFPVKLPHMKSEEFDRKKAEYTAKYGYTMHIPGLTDIIKIDIGKSPTLDETRLYRNKDVKALGPDRYEQIRLIKARKKKAFLRMMDSPTPTWINNIGSTMTFLDDINDAAGTLSVTCRIGAHMLPKIAGKILMGPAGWALTAADIAQVGMTIMRSPVSRLMKKSSLARATSTNPFSKEARVRRSSRLKRINISKGEIIEGLQTTNQIFGIGLSLGPIVGAMIEAFTGPFRALQGKKVRVKWPIPRFQQHVVDAMKGMTAVQVLNIGGQELSAEDHMKSYAVANMATQMLWPVFKDYHPLDRIEGIENMILAPRVPTDPLTKLLFEEEGIDPMERAGFLHTKEKSAAVSELMDIGFDYNPASFAEFAQLNKHTYTGLVGAQSVNDFAQNSLALIEGDDMVEIDFHPVEKALFKIMDAGDSFAPETTSEQLKCFADQIVFLEENNYDLTYSGFKPVIARKCGIKFISGDRGS